MSVSEPAVEAVEDHLEAEHPRASAPEAFQTLAEEAALLVEQPLETPANPSNQRCIPFRYRSLLFSAADTMPELEELLPVEVALLSAELSQTT